MYENPRLGDFFSDLKNIADKISQGAMAAGAIKEGDARITVVPTQQGVTNYASNLVGGIDPKVIAMVIGGSALLYFATRPSRRSRR